MEITLEKIELVKDRTGVTYKEAKEALEQTEGNVVDAIIRLEETVNTKKGFKPAQKSEELVAKIKEIVGRGNISRIMVKKDDNVILNIPLNAGIVGALVAPWGVVAGVVASFGFNCVIEFVKDNGDVIDLSSKAGEYIEVAKEKGQVVYEVAKEKGQAAYEVAKEKGLEAYDEFQEKAPEVYENAKEKSKDLFNQVKEKASEKFVKVEDEIEIIMDDIEEQIEDIEEEIKEELKKEDK